MVSFSQEQRILVTGASSGIGLAVAQTLLRLGATVLASGRNEEKLAALRAHQADPDQVILVPRELTEDMDSLPQWVRGLVRQYGKLRGLVCSAGIADPMSLQTLDLALARKLFDINYFSPLLLAQGFADRRVNTGPGAAMVFITSYAGQYPGRGQVPYCGSKAALSASARGISRELAPAGVRVNCIAPAAVKTPLTTQDSMVACMDTFLKETEHRYPLGLGEPQDVANLAAFLLSDEARWITGQEYTMDGGLV